MFNDKQLEAVNTLDGRVRVIAGAGSGKTAVLTQRYAELIKKKIDPKNILCITFTNKAANEMKERISKLTKQTDLPFICTFHSFCLKLLKEYSYIFGYPSNFAVLDSDDQTAMLKEVFKDCNIDREKLTYKTAKDIVADYKINQELYLLNVFKPDNTIKNLYKQAKEDYAGFHIDDKEILKKVVYFGYLYYQQKATGIDFNDMIILTCILLKEREDILKYWQKQFEYVLVDEYQDVSKRQSQLVEMLSDFHKNLFVVGDPDQTIYTWRGARPELLVDFDKNKETKTIIMNQNYRSTPNILDVANKIIEKNTLRIEKDLFTENPPGEKVIYKHYGDPEKEAAGIIQEIQNLLKDYKPKDIAVLYRMHALSRAIEERLIHCKIPYTIHSGTNFYERKEIKDILAYLKLIVNPNDDVSLKRIINVPARGIGFKTIADLKEYAEKKDCSIWEACNQFIRINPKSKIQDFVLLMNLLTSKKELPIRELTEFVIEKSGYGELLKKSLEVEREENIKELLSSMENKPLEDYLQEIMLLTNTDMKSTDVITLMTIHSAKGLEFPVVFVIGMSEGQLPSFASLGNKKLLEEERRLAYVAYTRAKEKLILTDAGGYGYNGERKTSRFIEEIPKHLLNTNKKESILQAWKPKAFVVKKHKEQDLDEEEITDATLYNPVCDIGTCITSRAIRNTKNKYSRSGNFHGQYFDEDGNYYDWDDDTYCQGLVNAEDIFDEGDFC